MSARFDSVLVANRGEIAVRVLKSAAAAGYRTIAVYSEADADAPHVALADEAVLIGPAPAAESYLDAQRLLVAAQRTGAGAVHPGYGFLSENAAFAAACAEAGLVFIGPSAEAIALMGDKAAAKRRMLEAGVPCVPGFQESAATDAQLVEAAQALGFPLMVKAAAGGGGRGMRLVAAEGELEAALAAARSEARNAFGSDELILEKAVLAPRHVEIQVFGDEHGEVLHFGERDCSVQRRHQKVVEEAPCPVMTPALRDAMGRAAVTAAKSIDYVGAGTVEFLLDGASEFYFLEMNTRLQVEHPVTELVTGLDLVDLQLRVAQGQPLGLAQDQVALKGHAIEVRLYAEDATQDFLPASGRVLDWRPPAGEGIRVDHGLVGGQVISSHYDPMIAKIVAFGADREAARRRLLRALRDTVVFGVETNREFLIEALARPRFAAGAATTAFISEEFADGFGAPGVDDEVCALAAVLQYRREAEADRGLRLPGGQTEAGGLGGSHLASVFAFGDGDDVREVRVTAVGHEGYDAVIGDRSYPVEVVAQPAPGRMRVALAEVQFDLACAFPDAAAVTLQYRGRSATLRNRLAADAVAAVGAGDGAIVAPMHGNLLALRVAVGDRVRRGDEVAVMEAMKMEHRLLATVDGEVVEVLGVEGRQSAAGAVVLRIDPEGR